MIRLQFVCGGSLSSQAIAWFSQGHLSHVDAILPDGTLLGARSDRIRGIEPGVRIRPGAYERWSSRVVFTLPSTVEQEAAFHGYLRRQIGKPYDHTAIWGFVLNRNWRESDSWICSELQAAALEHAGLVPNLYLSANKMTPVAVALVTSAIGAQIKTFNA